MKVYFTASTTGKKKYKIRYQKIIKVLEEMDHGVTTNFLTFTEQKKFLKKTPRVVYKETQKQIKDTDVVITELGDYVFGSFGVGWRVNYALSIQKPVLCLYPKGYDAYYISPLLKGSSSEFLTLKQYTMRSLKKLLEKYFNKIKKRQGVRINFITTPLIADYLNWIAYYRKVSKSKLIRDLLSQAIRSDKEYQRLEKSSSE